MARAPGVWPTRIAGLVLVAAFGAVLLAPLVTPYDPVAQPDILGASRLPPSTVHPFGTDQFSRDVFARVLFGGRVSLAVAVLAMLVSIGIGTAVGFAAGLSRGIVDILLMRFVDAAMAIPRLVLLVVIFALWDRVPLSALVLILGCTSWFHTSRLVRAEVLGLRNEGFVVAARALGVGPLRLVTRHVLPHAAPIIIVAATLGVGNILLIEAGLSYLGFGVAPPNPSWGNIIRDGSDLLDTAPWIAAFPGIAIIVTVAALSLVGEWLQAWLAPNASAISGGRGPRAVKAPTTLAPSFRGTPVRR